MPRLHFACPAICDLVPETDAPALLESDADVLAAALSALVESLGNEVSITYMVAELARTAKDWPACVEVETPHGVISIIEDRFSRTWMCCERGQNAVNAAIRVDEGTDPEALMDIGSRFLSGTI